MLGFALANAPKSLKTRRRGRHAGALDTRDPDRSGSVARRKMAIEEQLMNYEERIERRPNVAGGEAVLKGTRVTLRTVLASLAEGATTAEILADFPTLTEADVRAAIAFAAASAQEDLPVGAAHVR